MTWQLRICRAVFVGCLCVTASAAAQSDWPRFRGPDCTGICPETGLVQEIPEGGFPLLWQVEGCGTGYSSVSIVDGRIFTMGDRPDGGGKSQFVTAFDLNTQKELWLTKIGPPHGDGSRCTPTVDGDNLYVLGTSGDLVCLEAATGALKWKRNVERDFGGRMMSGWRWSESPLIDGDKVVCTPGVQDAVVVALEKGTGDLIWKCAMPDIGSEGKDGAGYASIVVSTIDGVRQYMTIVGRGAIGVAADTGKFLWGYNRIANGTANIPSPVVRGNHVFVTTSYRTGSALLKLTKDGDVFDVEEVYFLGPRDFENHHGGVVLVGDFIYGGDGQNKGIPVCLDFLTGKIKWKEQEWTRKARASGSAAVLYADGNLVFRYDNGLVALIEANPDEFRVKGTFQPAVNNGKAWSHPVIVDGKLFLRANDILMCYDVKQQ